MGNYTLGRLIGKGSFGKVYLASHKLTNGSKVCISCMILVDWVTDLGIGCVEVCEEG